MPDPRDRSHTVGGGREPSLPPLFVHGVTTAVPRQALDVQQSSELLKTVCTDTRTEKLLRRVIRLTGIEKRYLAVLDYQGTDDGATPLYLPPSEQPHGPGMGARNLLFEPAAATLVAECLRPFSHDALRRVDKLVTCSCTHASSPGLERPIFAQAPIPYGADRWNLGFMGCSAAMAALRLLHQGRGERGDALIVACELSSLHFQYTNKLDQLTANVLFSDGAAAVLLSHEPSAVRVIDCACLSAPREADQMVWFADDYGLRLDLSQELPETLAKYLPAAVGGFLARNGTAAGEIRHWLIHPGGPQVLDGAQESLGLGSEALNLSRDILRRYGNMSSPTILFILRALIEQKVEGQCVALAFGPGLTIEMALLEIRRG